MKELIDTIIGWFFLIVVIFIFIGFVITYFEQIKKFFKWIGYGVFGFFILWTLNIIYDPDRYTVIKKNTADDEFTFIERSCFIIYQGKLYQGNQGGGESGFAYDGQYLPSGQKTFYPVFCGFSDNDLPKNISDQLDNNMIYWSDYKKDFILVKSGDTPPYYGWYYHLIYD